MVGREGGGKGREGKYIVDVEGERGLGVTSW